MKDPKVGVTDLNLSPKGGLEEAVGRASWRSGLLTGLHPLQKHRDVNIHCVSITVSPELKVAKCSRVYRLSLNISLSDPHRDLANIKLWDSFGRRHAAHKFLQGM